MGQTDVTQEAFQRVTGKNPSHFRGATRPVDQVPWQEAQNYCQTTGMRLPTEEEWEYAARAGTTTKLYGNIDRIAWYDGNSGKQTHPVMQKEPNAWGLYDMLGNVFQWTADSYSDSYGGADETGFRSLRGGSWNDNDGNLVRVSYRLKGAPLGRNDYIGFRCAGE